MKGSRCKEVKQGFSIGKERGIYDLCEETEVLYQMFKFF